LNTWIIYVSIFSFAFRKGLKCIKKAYSLNAADDKICPAYVDELMALGYNDEAKEILVRTTQLASVEQ